MIEIEEAKKKAVLLKNWSLHFFAQFCLGVLSKFVLDPFSFGIELLVKEFILFSSWSLI
jgi:hypothetical protein